MSATTELLTVEEMAERLRVRPDTIRVWSRRSLIPAVRINAKIIRYDASEVIEALRVADATRRVDHEGIRPVENPSTGAMADVKG